MNNVVAAQTPILDRAVIETSTKRAPRVRLDYLDGLRGLAALYVVINHASIMAMKLTMQSSVTSHWLNTLQHVLHYYVFNYGVYSVAVFIVLSGYCLMLPIASSEQMTLKGGFADFVQRRARRIIPPYYAALGLIWLFYAVAPYLHIPTAEMTSSSLVDPVYGLGNVASHLLLVHDWTPYICRIDPPMWSVAVEWQIYFVFALLLLPLCRRLGIGITLGAAFLIGLGPFLLLNKAGGQMHLWFLGLFALGMFAALVNFSPQHATRWQQRPWLALTGFFTFVVLALTGVQRESWAHVRWLHWFREETWGSMWPLEVGVGLTTMCFLIYCTQRLREPQPGAFLPLRLCNAPAVVKLGTFSYSLYLIHQPILDTVWLAARSLPITLGVPVFFGSGVLLSVGLAWLFHLAFERRFMPGHLRQKAARAQAA